jgi:competence protein ComEC
MEGAADTDIAGTERLWQAPLPMLVALARGLRNALVAERDRWFLWLPAFLGAGIGIYFSLTIEPPLWLGLALGSLAIAGVAVARWRERGIAGAIAVAAVALGFAAAEIETRMVATPVLERPTGRVSVEGRVIDVEPLPAGQRFVIGISIC